MKKLLIILLIGISVGACKKEEAISDTPSIQWVDYGPQLITATQDSVYFSITYTDRDGDLGESDPNIKNLFIRDERIPLTYEFRISEIVPNGESVAIKGQLNFSLRNTIMTGSDAEEPVTYTIWLKDRSGNTSNELRTEGLRVKSP